MADIWARLGWSEGLIVFFGVVFLLLFFRLMWFVLDIRYHVKDAHTFLTNRKLWEMMHGPTGKD